MMGREAYSNPYLLAHIDQQLFGDDHPIADRLAIAEQYIAYCIKQMDKGSRLNHLSRHVLGLFHGEPGGRAFRRHISEHAHKENANADVLVDALRYIA